MINYLEIANDITFSSVLHSIQAEGTVLSLSSQDVALPNGTYYWRIKTTDAPNPDVFTPIISFTVTTFDGNYNLILSENENDIEIQTTNTTIEMLSDLIPETEYTWNVIGNGLIEDTPRVFTTASASVNYLEIASDGAFNNILHSFQTMGSVLSLSALNIALSAGTYYWRIKTADGIHSDVFTATASFVVDTFDGNYDVTISEGGNDTVIQTTNTNIETPVLLPENEYTWNVVGKGLVGDASRAFTTTDTPPVEVPTGFNVSYDNATNTITLTWDAVQGVTEVEILYKTNHAGGYGGIGLTLDVEGLQPVGSSFSVVGTSVVLYNAVVHTPYWFAIQATDGAIWSPMSERHTNITPTPYVSAGAALVTPEKVNTRIDDMTGEVILTWIPIV